MDAHETQLPAVPVMYDTTLGALSDNEVIDHARRLYARLKVVPRWSDENEDLVREWGRACGEMTRRGITDTVTEGGTVSVVGPQAP